MLTNFQMQRLRLNLEEYCAHLLNLGEAELALPQMPRRLTDTQKEKMAFMVNSKIKMLLLNKSYEP